ncbi:hypothetical protein FKM82_000564 [Ascaphus truei]
MDINRKLIFAIACMSLCGVLNALFTVQASKSLYMEEYGRCVSMECSFPVKNMMKFEDLKVYWGHSSEEGKQREVVNFSNGTETLSTQDRDYRGRVKILKAELYKGRAVLQINNVKLNDSGRYVCIISSDGADYKYITLKVQAPYKKINKRVTDIMTASGQRLREITCQSEGYPAAEVTWLNERQNLSVVANTSYTVTADQMFNVTSVLRVSLLANNVTCIFWNEAFQEATSETFTISDESGNAEKRSHMFMLLVIAVVAVLIVLVTILIKINGTCTGSSKAHAEFSKHSSTQSDSLPFHIHKSLTPSRPE